MPSITLNEKTLVPISLVIVLGGGIFWLSTVFAQVRHNGVKINEINNDQKVYLQTVQQIDRRLSNIEGRLGIESKED